jgi:hypothetical protein
MRNVNPLVSNVLGPVGATIPFMHKFSMQIRTLSSIASLELSHINQRISMCAMISSSRRLCREVTRCKHLRFSKALPAMQRCFFSTNPRWTNENPHQPWAHDTQPSFASSSMSMYPPFSSINMDTNVATTAYSLPSQQRLRLLEMVHHIPLAVQIRKQRDIPVGDPADPILRLLRYAPLPCYRNLCISCDMFQQHSHIFPTFASSHPASVRSTTSPFKTKFAPTVFTIRLYHTLET